MKIPLALMFLFLCRENFAQSASPSFQCNQSNIYFQAIDQYLQFMEKEEKKADTLFLESNEKITDSLLSECRYTKLIKLNNDQLKDRLKKGKSLNLYRIMPLEAKDGSFAVKLIPFGCGFNKTKRKYELLNGGNYVLLFQFDGEQLVFRNMEGHGI